MSKWPSVPLGSAIQHRKEFIQIDDLADYKRCRVQLHAQGIVLRDTVPGVEIKTKKQQVCKAGDFLVAEIDAKVGGFGIVPKNLDGAVVSSHYFLFEVNDQLLSRQFLDFFIRTPAFREQVAAQGSTNYAAIRPNDVLGYKIPLPPLPEQRRIVSRIESLTAKIEEAQGLRRQTMEEIEAFLRWASSAILDSPKWGVKRLESVLAESPRNGLSPQLETESSGRPMLRINAVSSAPSRFVDLSAYKNVEVTNDVAAPFVLQHDDVFIVRYNGDINRVAKAAIFKSESKTQVVYPDKLMRLRADPKKMLPDFMVLTLGSRRLREQIEKLGKTTAGQIGVSGADAKGFLVPVPPVEEQSRIVTYLDGLQAKVDALKKLQAETAAELAAMLPSILDKAFKGEL